MMEGFHKESKRIISAIRSNNAMIDVDTAYAQSFYTQVSTEDWKTFEIITSQIASVRYNTCVMIGALVESKRHLFIGLMGPTSGLEWIKASTSSFSPTTTTITVQHLTEFHDGIDPSGAFLVDISFDETSEETPFKAIDQVFAASAVYLRKVGVIADEEDEYEYGFDDL
jgi:hypothetical protein